MRFSLAASLGICFFSGAYGGPGVLFFFPTEPTPPIIVAPPPPPPPPPPVSDVHSDDGSDNDIVSEMDLLDYAGAPFIGSSSSGSDEGMPSDVDHPSQHSAAVTLKRKRGQMDFDAVLAHRRISYNDELLDYFMTKDIDVPAFLLAPPPGFDVDEVVDTEGHTAIHWAAAMDDLKVIELPCKADANMYAAISVVKAHARRPLHQ